MKCYINGTSESASFQWLGPPNNQTLTTDVSGSRMVSSNSTVTVLQFTALQASHAGLYICRATVRNAVMKESYVVRVNCKSNNDIVIV